MGNIIFCCEVTMAMQLDFFTEKTDIDFLKEEVSIVRQSSDKVRKSLFARHNELCKMYMELHERMEIIEKNICIGVK